MWSDFLEDQQGARAQSAREEYDIWMFVINYHNHTRSKMNCKLEEWVGLKLPYLFLAMFLIWLRKMNPCVLAFSYFN